MYPSVVGREGGLAQGRHRSTPRLFLSVCACDVRVCECAGVRVCERASVGTSECVHRQMSLSEVKRRAKNVVVHVGCDENEIGVE